MKLIVILLLFTGPGLFSQEFSGRPLFISGSSHGNSNFISFSGPVRLINSGNGYARISMGNPYHLPGLYSNQVDLVRGFKKYTVSLKASRIGTSFFSWQNFSGGITNRFDWGILGISFVHHYLSAEGRVNKGSWAFDWGGLFQLDDNVYYETSISNISFWNRNRIGSLSFSMGIWSRISDQVIISGAYKRKVNIGNSFEFMIDFIPRKHVELFIFMDPLNALASGGIRINPGNWGFSYFHLIRQNLKNSSRWEAEWWF